MMSPPVRRLALTAHVSASVGWMGAVAVFLALALVGLFSPDVFAVRAAYASTDVATWYVIVPMCIAALLTGLVQSLGTPWGLVRHYWVLAKLGLTVIATVLLLLHTGPIGTVAAFAASSILTATDLPQLRVQLVGDASAAIFVLLLTTILSIYKPWGPTPYGRRVEADSGASAGAAALSWTRRHRAGVTIALGLALLIALVLMHLMGMHPGGH